MSGSKEYLLEMGAMDKEFSALYRNIALKFNISECAMWILYYLALKGNMTQQEMHELMMFPKQTINSSVISLQKKGLVQLEMIPGTRNLKKVELTEAGRSFADDTVGRMIKAEETAVKKMGKEKMELYISLHEEMIECLRKEFIKKGVIDGE